MRKCRNVVAMPESDHSEIMQNHSGSGSMKSLDQI
jgi:hypothetical protein